MKTIICQLIFSTALVFAGLSSAQNAAAGELSVSKSLIIFYRSPTR
jgi:hypothetical protein